MSWSPKKWVFGSCSWRKQVFGHFAQIVPPLVYPNWETLFSVTSECLRSRKYDELSKSVAFGQKLRYFTDQNGSKGGPQENEF